MRWRLSRPHEKGKQTLEEAVTLRLIRLRRIQYVSGVRMHAAIRAPAVVKNRVRGESGNSTYGGSIQTVLEELVLALGYFGNEIGVGSTQGRVNRVCQEFSKVSTERTRFLLRHEPVVDYSVGCPFRKH